ncbi:MAG: ribonuclease R, partial [Rubritepida sp.]|nr:ribonuclease R [Rubritepida sp.]
MKAAPKGAPLPTKPEIRAFLATAQGRVGKTEIARHFGLATEQRPALRQLLSEMKLEASAAPVGKRTFQGGGFRPSAPGRLRSSDASGAPERLPDTGVVEVFGTDPDGDPIARPVAWAGEGKPIVYMHPERRGQTALAPGERVLARLRHLGGDKYEGRTLKRLGKPQERARILGVFQDGRIIPTDRRQKAEWVVPKGEEGGAHGGEIVLAEALPSTGFGLRPARIVERLGQLGEPRSVSLICIHTHGIPDLFTAEAEREAERAEATPLGSRTDLRDIPLVTIDGEDARDFDD